MKTLCRSLVLFFALDCQGVFIFIHRKTLSSFITEIAKKTLLNVIRHQAKVASGISWQAFFNRSHQPFFLRQLNIPNQCRPSFQLL
ncbi:hypothetical protein F0T03_02420 [Yersinia canariae]|uniref:Uncharacterized protein n=1 Tax=Yersinia canariae TaxID=2607663 RepID=A0A857EUA1_9GAMM|nr:hypothetical protein F0T03_02420 [Yersinia canariae]